MSDVTQILEAIESGNAKAADELLPLVYDELRKLAAHRMAGETPGQTLQATALVHEAWLRLVGKDAEVQFQNRAHFFSAAAEAMRRILIENARRKHRFRHGGGHQRVDLQNIDLATSEEDDELLAVDEALDRLAGQDEIKARLVKFRYFVGMTNEEAAPLLGISIPTAKRYWRYAKAWLHREIKQNLH